jgi:hypothetical protein
MSKNFTIWFGVAVFGMLLLVWLGFIQTKANHLAPTGSISQVRTQTLADDLTLAIIDFNIVNDSDQQMVVTTIDPWITTPGGTKIHGSLYAAGDIAKTFAFYPKLGDQIGPPLLLRGTIDGHKALDRMVAVEFDVPQRVVDSRREIALRLEDITGPELEMTKNSRD